MNKIKLYQVICGVFPPILSQSIRDKIFPLKKARALALEFSKTSITGSKFYGNTADDHSYRFAVHGFFDWRNIIAANRYVKSNGGDIIEIGANVGTETKELDYRCFTIERSSLKAVDKIDLDFQKSQNWFCVPNEKTDIIDEIQKDLLFRAYVPWYLLKPLKKGLSQ